MFTRRGFAAMIAAGLTEAAFAQRAAVPRRRAGRYGLAEWKRVPGRAGDSSLDVMARDWNTRIAPYTCSVNDSPK